MGPQWWAMGQELIRTEPVVARTIDEIDVHFKRIAGWSLREAMTATEADSRMERTEVAQTANFALQAALTALWDSYGIRPVAVVGHSVGEVASGYIAGVYSLEEAVTISYHRSRLQQTTAGLGSMLAVGLPEAGALELLPGSPGVSIAAINSFNAVTLSGDTAQLREIAAVLEKREIFNKFLRVEVAYHSPQMDPLEEELATVLSGLVPKPADAPLSTAYGKLVPSEKWGADYWWRNVRQPVRFAAAMQAMFEDGYTSFVEVGPHPVLGNSIKECAAQLEQKVTCFTSLRRKEPENRQIMQALSELYCAGFCPIGRRSPPGMGALFRGLNILGSGSNTGWNLSARERRGWELLARCTQPISDRTDALLGSQINRNYFPFLFDHGVQNQTVFAGMGYIEAAITLNSHINKTPVVILENVSLEKVLIIDYSKLQYLLSEYFLMMGGSLFPAGWRARRRVSSGSARGGCIRNRATDVEKLEGVGAFRAACPKAVAIEEFYKDLSGRGLHYGPTFRPTTDVQVGDACFFIKIDSSNAQGEEDHLLHPTLFDAAIQPVLYCSAPNRVICPLSIEQFRYFSRPDSAECYAYGRLVRQTDTMVVADVWLMDSAGVVHAAARNMACQVIETGDAGEEADVFYLPEWKLSQIDLRDEADGSQVIIFADAAGSDLALADELEARLKGARKVVTDLSGSAGFGKCAMKELLEKNGHKQRKNLVVLWEPNRARR